MSDTDQPLPTRVMLWCVCLAIGIVALAGAVRAALWLLAPAL